MDRKDQAKTLEHVSVRIEVNRLISELGQGGMVFRQSKPEIETDARGREETNRNEAEVGSKERQADKVKISSCFLAEEQAAVKDTAGARGSSACQGGHK